MKKRWFIYAAWAALACLLYFFENNTGTRIALFCSLLLPLLGRNTEKKQPQSRVQSVKAFEKPEKEDPGDVRVYLPGDPVNRIHWKLSAKRNELLVRDRVKDPAAEETEIKAVFEAEQPAGNSIKKRAFLLGISIFLLSLALLFMIPSAKKGMQALLNRLFDASEAANAYAYEHFSVPLDQPAAFAAVLLSVIGLSLMGLIILSGSRLLALGMMAGCVLFQTYFGLSFPAWVNVPLFALFALWLMKERWSQKTVLSVLLGVLIVSMAVLILYPGVDAPTEAASEAVRDRLSQTAQSLAGAARELTAGENETRHVHTQSLTAGDQEAQTDRAYSLVTVEEEQISMPHWVDYLRILLLLLLTMALVILPFLPFILLNRRRKKALDARMAFDSENVSEAVIAIFQHVAAWLEAMGYGKDNAPYAAWNAELAPDYSVRFAACERMFEEAAYSTHEMKEEDRQQALALLNETEQILQQRADWKQRLRLRYKECLWI